jgi:mRNA interferase RelE/StbE
MRYELAFKEKALSEWQSLDASVREQLKKKLLERLDNPRIISAKLNGHPNRYKIKLLRAGIRLVYEVQDSILLVTVIVVGKRENNWVYEQANMR